MLAGYMVGNVQFFHLLENFDDGGGGWLANR